jgi:hypothetical protein
LSTSLSPAIAVAASKRCRPIALHAMTGADDTSSTMGARAQAGAVPPGALGGTARKEAAGTAATAEGDQGLLEGLRRGDPAASTALVRKYH